MPSRPQARAAEGLQPSNRAKVDGSGTSRWRATGDELLTGALRFVSHPHPSNTQPIWGTPPMPALVFVAYDRRCSPGRAGRPSLPVSASATDAPAGGT